MESGRGSADPHGAAEVAAEESPVMHSDAAEELLAVFDSEHAEHLRGEELDDLLARMLALHPQAPVTAMTEHGLVIPPPDSIAVASNPITETRAAGDAISLDESVLNAWQKLFEQGVARADAHPIGHPEMTLTLYMFDLRERHGVLLSIAVADGFDMDELAAEREGLADLVPRFARVRKDSQAMITEVDEAFTKILGWSGEEVVGHRSLEFIHPDDHSLAVESWVEMLTTPGLGRRVRLRHRRKSDGEWLWFEVTNQNLLGDPEHACVITDMLDITEEMTAHEEVRARQQLLDRLASAVPVGLLQTDAAGRVVYTNERLHEIVGVPRAESVAEQLETVIADDRALIAHALGRVLGDGEESDIEVRLRQGEEGPTRFCTISLRPLSHEDGTVSGAIGCIADVTESARMREELKTRATFDDLTGCYNRASIMLALEANLEACGDRAVVFVDVDRFKEVNDRHGHAVGDEILRTVAARLRAGVRDTDLIGRIGGDEFIVVCPEIGDLERARKLAARLAGLVERQPIEGAPEIVPHVSVGVAWSGGDGLSADALVAEADAAMYEAKRRARQPA